MENLQKKVNELLQNAVGDGQIAGANCLVIKDGRQIVYAQAGFADVEGKKPFCRDTICRIYSMTKPVTAVAAMILMERGLLDLGKPVGDYIPAFRAMQVWENGKKVPAKRNLLVKDLLSMTSGLAYPGTDDAGREADLVYDEVDKRLYTDNAMTTMEYAEKIGACGLAFHPGDAWMYGTSADILGAVVEVASGMKFGEFLRNEIFEPLEMWDTGFYVPEEKQHRLALVYDCYGPMKVFETNNLGICYTMHRPPALESGGAGLTSTIDDYVKLAQSLLGHGKQILKRSTIEFMTSGKLLPWQQESLWRAWDSMPGYTYSNLCRILVEPGMAVLNGWKGEYGWDGWLGTYFCNSPANDATVLLFTQRRDAGTLPVTRQIRNVLTAWL